MTSGETETIRALIDKWRENADMLAEGSKGEWGSEPAAMQRACADELAALLQSRPPERSAQLIADILADRAGDLTKQSCEECEACAAVAMCAYHSLLSELQRHVLTSAELSRLQSRPPQQEQDHHPNCDLSVASCTCAKERERDARMDSSTQLDKQRATASPVAPDPTAKPYFWMDPNPAGVARQLMKADEVAEFLREIPEYAVAGEGVALTLVFMTDAEVDALPCV